MTSLIHNPVGQEHPYEQLPEERFPRLPLADQGFRIGIVTRPVGAVEEVTVHAQIDGGDIKTIPAMRLDNWQPELEEGVGAEYLERIVRIEQDVWQADLTAPPAGKTLSYWMTSGDIESERFSVSGWSWEQSGGIEQTESGQIAVSRAESNTGQSLDNLRKIEWLTDGKSARQVRLTFECPPDERFYGLGERFNALDQRGNIMDIRVFEQYKSQGKRTYMPIPFMLSSCGYGLWVKSSRWMQFDLASTDETSWTLTADLDQVEVLNLQVFRADDPFEIVGQFASETGPVTLPPDWSFGLWMSGNEWNTQAKIEQEVALSLDHDIQPAVIVIEAWSDETTFYIWNDAQYDPTSGDKRLKYEDFSFPPDGKWTDPKAMVDQLHDQGVKVLLWQVPVLKQADHAHSQHDADREYYENSGFGVHEADGSLHKVRPFWFRGGYIWDVTNPNERDWWLNKRKYLLEDIGIDGFKTDGGEHLWGESVVFADGRTGSDVWNEYPQLYTSAYYEFANQHRTAVTFSRAGYTGSQRAPLHWAGDENSTWDAYRHSVLAGLSAGVSGIPFWGWDIGGFSGEIPSAELYLRSTAMAAFCPVMQYHSEFNAHRLPSHDRTPWNIQDRSGNDRVIEIFRWFVNVRHNLMPYIWQEAQHTAKTGRPMMQALAVNHPHASPYQYMFGRDLLVCPIVEPDTTETEIYLPSGNWRDLWRNELITGDQRITVDVPIDSIPVYVRDGARIPVRWGDNRKLGESVPLSTTPNGYLDDRA